ncbi:MAG: hypothetical protein GXX95_00520 [Methanomassiliicoccus sp.]|nr:hypothetical protein [Methanomassiliicoccus sp.]
MSLGNDFMDSQARILVYFHGHVDEGRLEEAVRLTLVACPWLAYRYVDDRHRPCWQRVEEGEWSQFLDMAVCPLTDPRFYQFINEPLLTDSAPQVRVGLFRGEDDVLCIRSNHMALDGGGAVNYLSLLASTYKELGKDTRHSSIKVTADRPGPLQVLREVGVLNAIRALPHIDLPGRPWGVPRTGDDDARGVYTVTQLSPERLNAVREYARVRKVTVNDVLLASFYRSLFEVCAPPAGARLMVEVPVNLRKYLPRSQTDVPSDLSAVYLVNIERVENETYEQTLDRVHRQLSKKKSNRVELAELVLLELFMFPGPWLLKKLKEIVGFKAAHPVLSNLGEVNTRSADFGGPEVKDVHFIGPLLYPPNIGVGIYTFRGRLNVSLNYPCSAVDERTMERFLDLFLKEIPGPAEVPSSTELDMEGDNEKKAERTVTSEKVVCICPPPT